MVKNQHYIPEGLVRNFVNTDDQIIEVLLRNKKIYPTNPSNSMSETFVYEHENLKTNTVENFFAEMDGKIVPQVKQIIEKIILLKKSGNGLVDIKNEVESLLSVFIIFYYRSGALLTEFSSIDSKDKVPLLSKKILNHRYVESLAKTIKNFYKFAIIESSDDFLLSDQFISTAALKIKSQFFDISNRHVGLKDTLILIPISSSYYIIYWNSDRGFDFKEDAINSLDGTNVKLVNKAIINNSYIKCVGKKKERLEDVLDDYVMAFPSQIYAGGNPSGYFCGAIKKKEVFFYEDDKAAWELLEFGMFTRYKELGRNDLCACGSKNKFKKCHLDAYNKIKKVIRGFGDSDQGSQNNYGIPGALAFELPVESWEGYDNK